MIPHSFSKAGKPANPVGRPPVLAAVVLAAGMSQRLGRPKQLLRKAGRIAPAYVLSTILEIGLDPLILVLGCQAKAALEALDSPTGLSTHFLERIRILYNPDFSSGQASSVRAGVRALGPEVDGAFFFMADQPDVKKDVVQGLADRFIRDGSRVVRPLYGGRPGGPVLWSRSWFDALKTLTGDQGGRALWGRMPPGTVVDVEFGPDKRPADLDTEADVRAWKAAD